MAHFLQSDAWKAFQDAQGLDTVQLSGNDGHEWSALAIHEQGAGNINRLYAPYGPSFATEADLGEALMTLEKTAKDAGDVFVRVEPVALSVDDEKNIPSILKARGYRRVDHIQPEDTLIADVSLGAETVLKNLKSSIRRAYNGAEKRDVHIKTTTDPNDIHFLTSLMARVSERNKVQLRDAEYIEAQAKILLPKGAARLYLATTSTSPEGEEIEETVIAAVLLYLDEDAAYYAHVASDYAWHKVKANVIIMVQMMLDAANEGRKRFDFYGIAPEDAPEDHPWQGFTNFKMRFGGERRTYLGTWEKPVRRAKYFAYNWGRKILGR